MRTGQQVSQWLTLGPILSNIFINRYKFGENTEVRGVADTPDGCAAIRGDLGRLKKQADRNLIKYNNGNGQVVHQQEITLHQYMLRANHLESSVSWQI